MGNSSSSPEITGYQIVRVLENSPASKSRLTPYFDFIIKVNDQSIAAKGQEIFKIALKENQDKELKLCVYSTKTKGERDVTVVPTTTWGGEGLLGCSIYYRNVASALESTWRILEVEKGSPADESGLQREVDYVLGTSGGLFDTPNDFGEIISKSAATGVTLMVYDSATEMLREVRVVPRKKGNVVGLGCSVGNGALHRIPVTPQRSPFVPCRYLQPEQPTEAAASPALPLDSAPIATSALPTAPVENEGHASLDQIPVTMELSPATTAVLPTPPTEIPREEQAQSVETVTPVVEESAAPVETVAPIAEQPAPIQEEEPITTTTEEVIEQQPLAAEPVATSIESVSNEEQKVEQKDIEPEEAVAVPSTPEKKEEEEPVLHEAPATEATIETESKVEMEEQPAEVPAPVSAEPPVEPQTETQSVQPAETAPIESVAVEASAEVVPPPTIEDSAPVTETVPVQEVPESQPEAPEAEAVQPEPTPTVVEETQTAVSVDEPKAPEAPVEAPVEPTTVDSETPATETPVTESLPTEATQQDGEDDEDGAEETAAGANAGEKKKKKKKKGKKK